MQTETELEGVSLFQFWLSTFSPDRPDPYTPNPRFSHPVYDTTRLFWQTVTLITAGLCFIESDWSSTGLQIWFIGLIVYLFGHKIYYFYRKRWLLYFIDLCYYSMMHCVLKVIGGDSVSTNSANLFVLINGPVLGSSLVLKQRTGFYDREVYASFFLHILQAWFSYYARQVECINDGETIDEVKLFGETFVYYYLPWAGCYFVAIMIKPYIPILQNFPTLYDDTVNPGVPLLTDDFKTSLFKKTVYMFAHGAASLAGAIAAAFSFNNKYCHLIFLGATFASCLWNESEFYETALFNVKRSGLSGVYFLITAIIMMIIVGFITDGYGEKLPNCADS